MIKGMILAVIAIAIVCLWFWFALWLFCQLDDLFDSFWRWLTKKFGYRAYHHRSGWGYYKINNKN